MLSDKVTHIVSTQDLRVLAPPGATALPSLVGDNFSGNPDIAPLVQVSVNNLSCGDTSSTFLLSAAGLWPLKSSAITQAMVQQLSFSWFSPHLANASTSAGTLNSLISFAVDAPSAAWSPMPTGLVTATLLYGPPHANAELRKSTATIELGVAKADLCLSKGRPGIYIARLSVGDPTVEAAVVAIRASSAVARVDAVVGGVAAAAAGDSAASTLFRPSLRLRFLFAVLVGSGSTCT
jgi:hypothetical protein